MRLEHKRIVITGAAGGIGRALAEALPEAAESMTRFATRFPLMLESCASVVVGLNSEEQVAELCGHAQGVRPDPKTVAEARAIHDRMTRQEG